MDSRKYSMYRFFFSIPEDAFILCIGFFYRFRKMLLEAEIIDSVFYVCHLRYIYIVHIYIYIYLFVYTYSFKKKHISSKCTPVVAGRGLVLVWRWSILCGQRSIFQMKLL